MTQGFVAAFGVGIGVALLGALVYTTFMMTGHEAEFFEGLLSGRPGAWEMLVFVAFGAVIVSSVMSLAMTVLVLWPLYVLSRRIGRVSERDYVVGGCVISLVALGIIALPGSPTATMPNAMIWRIAILGAGPLATRTLWKIVRPDCAVHGQR